MNQPLPKTEREAVASSKLFCHFAAGKDYVLGKVAKSSRLGVRNNPIHGPIHGPRHSNEKAPHQMIIRHRTTNIRKAKKQR